MCWSWPLQLHLDWDSLCFLNLHGVFPLHVQEDFCHYFFKQGFSPLLLFFFWNSYDLIFFCVCVCFMLSCSSLKLSSYFLNMLSWSCSTWVFLSTLSSSSLILSSASYRPIVVPSGLGFLFFFF